MPVTKSNIQKTAQEDVIFKTILDFSRKNSTEWKAFPQNLFNYNMQIIKNKLDKFGTKAIGKLGPYINPLLLKLKSENKQLLIFCFHGLFDTLKQKALNHIDPQHNMLVSQFDEFIDYFLNHRYKFIKSEDLLSGMQENQRYAMVTFDDGYFNNMPAFDITKKYKIPAIYFLTTRNIIENKSYWWDIIYKYRHKQGNSLKAIGKEQSFLKGFKHPDIEKYIIQNFGIKFMLITQCLYNL